MKTLEEIKDEVAYELSLIHKRDFNTWDEMENIDFMWGLGISKLYSITDIMEKVTKRFALEVAKEALRNAAENAEIEDYPDPNHGGYGKPEYYSRVNKESILSETNIPEL